MRGDGGPVLGTAVGAHEQCIFLVQRGRADGTLDGVVVELDVGVVEIPGKATVSSRNLTAKALAAALRLKQKVSSCLGCDPGDGNSERSKQKKSNNRNRIRHSCSPACDGSD